MAKIPKKSGKLWTNEDISKLKTLVKQNTPTRLIALKLDRSEAAVRSKASDLDLSLKPTNQSPYKRKK